MPGEPANKTAVFWSSWLEENVTPEVVEARIKDRLLMITGTSTEKGLGYPVVLTFVKNGGYVILPVRSPQKAEEKVIATLASDLGWDQQAVRRKVVTAKMDLCSFDSVRSFVKDGLKTLASDKGGRFDLFNSTNKIDYLANSAAIMNAPPTQTADGFDHQIQTNLLGHFLLQALMSPYLAADATTLQIGSYVWKLGHYLDLDKRFSRWDHTCFMGGWKRYAQSKIGPMTFAIEAARREKAAGGQRRHVMCQPGLCATYLQKEHSGCMGSMLQRSAQHPYDGSLNYLHALLKPELQGGEFVDPEKTETGKPRPRKVPLPKIYDEEIGKRFWAVCEECVGEKYVV